MYLNGVLLKSRLRRFPRTRGDVPRTGKQLVVNGALPPHTRGCTVDRHRRVHRHLASPAHAGMYPRSLRQRREIPGFPRTRGDVPPAASTPSSARRASPAHAGMYRCGLCGCRPGICFPPHTRGCTGNASEDQPHRLASPAHAGMYPRSRWSRRAGRRFPRTRGDVPSAAQARMPGEQLPPHTRGCTELRAAHALPYGASPAHAGMYRRTRRPSSEDGRRSRS